MGIRTHEFSLTLTGANGSAEVSIPVNYEGVVTTVRVEPDAAQPGGTVRYQLYDTLNELYVVNRLGNTAKTLKPVVLETGVDGADLTTTRMHESDGNLEVRVTGGNAGAAGIMYVTLMD